MDSMRRNPFSLDLGSPPLVILPVLCIAEKGPGAGQHRTLRCVGGQALLWAPQDPKFSSPLFKELRKTKLIKRPQWNHSEMKMKGPHLKQGSQGDLCFLPTPFYKGDQMRTKSQVQPALLPGWRTPAQPGSNASWGISSFLFKAFKGVQKHHSVALHPPLA